MSGTVTDSAGRSATATRLVRLDRTKPTLKIRGARDGATYDERRTLRCKARDTSSGVATCKVRERTVRRDGEVVVRWRAVARDVAGNKVVRRGHYGLR